MSKGGNFRFVRKLGVVVENLAEHRGVEDTNRLCLSDELHRGLSMYYVKNFPFLISKLL